MFGKLMSISDELMWRYYELLTDVTMREIEEMKQDVAEGAAHPMKLKQELGKPHRAPTSMATKTRNTPPATGQRMFQKDETPEDLPVVKVAFEDVAAPNCTQSTDGKVQVKPR